MSNKLLSIIIPTYNMEKYLYKCISSLTDIDASLLELLDILIIDDGSKDSSLSIANDYQRRFSNSIRVFDKSNGNYGSCVNMGLSHATGKYVKILDADDYFDTNEFEKYLSVMLTLDVDMILNRVNIVNEEYDITAQWHFPISDNAEVCYWDFIKDYGWLNMHMVAYKTENIKKINYHQTEGISYTDQEWIHLPITTVETVFSIPVYLYQYLVGRAGQTMAVQSSKINKDYVIMLSALGNAWKEYNGPAHKKDFLKNKFINQTMRRYDEFVRFSLYSQKDFRLFDKTMTSRFPILKDYSNRLTIHKWGGEIPFIRIWRNPVLYTLYRVVRKILDLFLMLCYE